MSIEAMQFVWKNSRQSGSALLVLLALADAANDDGVCWPSLNTLAGKSRLSKRYVQSIIDSLITAGEISKIGRATSKYKNSTIYRVNYGSIPLQTDATTMEAGSYSETKDTMEAGIHSGGGQRVTMEAGIHQSLINPSINKKEEEESFLVSPLSVAFEKATQIVGHSPQRWAEAITELEKLGATPEIVTNTVNKMREKGYKMTGPWSILNGVRMYISSNHKNNGKAKRYDEGEFADYLDN